MNRYKTPEAACSRTAILIIIAFIAAGAFTTARAQDGFFSDKKVLKPHTYSASLQPVIYTKQYNLLSLGKRAFEGSPEFIDTLINMPQLISDGARFLEETLNNRVPEKKTDGNRSAIISSAFIISGVLALIQDAHVAIPSVLLAIGVLLALFGRK